ncbi:nucleotide disphospho-sugar-binding domain-containing protein [Streptomyces sp. NPDC023838]|uniref:nucleotide disphospho-sugar-binding domain-containing protein n=1 Tax=Streptomyces sp. NPDC023838 TaxID=3154325 RepID=UPI0033FC5FEA
MLVAALAPSHLLCMVPMAWAARAAGHEVLVVGRAEVAQAARRAGLPAAEAAELPVPAPGTEAAAPTAGTDPGPGGLAQALTSGQRRAFAGRAWPAGGHPWQVRVGRVVDGFLAAARQFRPDLVLCDPIEFTGLVVAAVLDVPAVVQRWGGPDSLSADAIARARALLAEPAARLGATRGLPEPALTLDPCPPSLRLDAPAGVRPVRFVPFNGAQPIPPWARRAERRRVCVTFGLFGSQAAQSGADFIEGGDLAARLDAVARALLPHTGPEVVMTVPQTVRPLLKPLPDRFRIVERAPLDALFGSCDLVIHHGGTGTAMTACARGVPQLLLPPPHPALADCAAGLARRGVGMVLQGADQTDPGALAAAVTGLTAGDDGAAGTGFREQARALAAEIAAQPAPAELVPVLASLV